MSSKMTRQKDSFIFKLKEHLKRLTNKENALLILVSAFGLIFLSFGVLTGAVSIHVAIFLTIMGAVILIVVIPIQMYHPKFVWHARVFFHVVGGIFACIVGSIWTRETLIVVFAGLTFIFVTLSLLDQKGLRTTFSGGRGDHGTSHYLSGTYWLISSLLLLTLFRPVVAYAAILIFSIGDASASLFGRMFGKIRNPLDPTKTIEGSIIGFIVAFLGATLYVQPMVALVGSVLGMFIEVLPLPLNDNLTVPLSAGILMQLTLLFV